MIFRQTLILFVFQVFVLNKCTSRVLCKVLLFFICFGFYFGALISLSVFTILVLFYILFLWFGIILWWIALCLNGNKKHQNLSILNKFLYGNTSPKLLGAAHFTHIKNCTTKTLKNPIFNTHKMAERNKAAAKYWFKHIFFPTCITNMIIIKLYYVKFHPYACADDVGVRVNSSAVISQPSHSLVLATKIKS